MVVFLIHIQGRTMNFIIRMSLFFLVFAPITSFASEDRPFQVDRSVVIVGGGIVGLFEAYNSYKEALAKGERVQIIILEKNKKLSETTTYNIVPSLTPDEILAVVPRGDDLVAALNQKFNIGEGIRVDDVSGLDLLSERVAGFIDYAKIYGKDDKGHQARTDALLSLGKKSMDLWQQFYDEADPELQSILRQARYKPCTEVSSNERALYKGYRIDMIFEDPAAHEKVKAMQEKYQNLGYLSSRPLSPQEVVEMDPQLKNLVYKLSYVNTNNELVWADDAAALWRPGGCLDSYTFLPLFVDYLDKQMTVTLSNGEKVKLFEIKYDHKVVGSQINDCQEVEQLMISSQDGSTFLYPEKVLDMKQEFIFSPGEMTGVLKGCGFDEPYGAVFAGPSLVMRVDLSDENSNLYSSLDHYMELHQEGVVFSWQARKVGSQVYAGLAGTKAFYGNQLPNVAEEFAQYRNLHQLNTLNTVFPDLISSALGRPTQSQMLTKCDLDYLVKEKVLAKWVGCRTVAYDGFPTFGPLYANSQWVTNARATTHLGSGGASFVHGAIYMSRLAMKKKIDSATPLDDLELKVCTYSDSRR
ncbi:MAG: hypothetical protein S4CHLAM6_11530 [Chlamydiae bacterium]|nr:hypothetical protein [Chlamydiota bacterium]